MEDKQHSLNAYVQHRILSLPHTRQLIALGAPGPAATPANLCQPLLPASAYRHRATAGPA